MMIPSQLTCAELRTYQRCLFGWNSIPLGSGWNKVCIGGGVEKYLEEQGDLIRICSTCSRFQWSVINMEPPSSFLISLLSAMEVVVP